MRFEWQLVILSFCLNIFFCSFNLICTFVNQTSKEQKNLSQWIRSNKLNWFRTLFLQNPQKEEYVFHFQSFTYVQNEYLHSNAWHQIWFFLLENGNFNHPNTRVESTNKVWFFGASMINRKQHLIFHFHIFSSK